MENKLASYLEANGLTQADFARRVGITQSALSKICNGGSTSLDTAVAIERESGGSVKATDLKPFDVIGGK
jgi:transcriptional regulator with XRE-family HTH domain